MKKYLLKQMKDVAEQVSSGNSFHTLGDTYAELNLIIIFFLLTEQME